jgi:hypothetical protein
LPGTVQKQWKLCRRRIKKIDEPLELEYKKSSCLYSPLTPFILFAMMWYDRSSAANTSILQQCCGSWIFSRIPYILAAICSSWYSPSFWSKCGMATFSCTALKAAQCRWYRWCTLTCNYLREFSKKFLTILIRYSGARRKLIDEKNQKQKISWHCPFKYSRHFY